MVVVNDKVERADHVGVLESRTDPAFTQHAPA
jgi:hypothetical protein